MPQIIATTAGRAETVQTVELDGVRYRIRLTWNGRTRSWYMDLEDIDGKGIAVGRRLSPGSFPVPKNVPGAPPGTFYVTSQLDPYDQADLGEGMDLVYIPRTELDAIEAQLAAEDDDVVVEF